jgi:hypothetical protein
MGNRIDQYQDGILVNSLRGCNYRTFVTFFILKTSTQNLFLSIDNLQKRYHSIYIDFLAILKVLVGPRTIHIKVTLKFKFFTMINKQIILNSAKQNCIIISKILHC